MADEVRNTQTTIEILREAGDQKGRITQSTIEVLREIVDQKARITQSTIEVMREADDFPPISLGGVVPGLTIIT